MNNLIRLAEKGSLKRFKACLDSEKHPLDILEEALRYALAFGHAAKAKLLLDAGVNPLAVNGEGSQFLTHAAVGGKAEMIRHFLDLGCDPDHIASTGRTPLHNAAYSKKPESVAALLTAGADPDVKDKQGWTPLLDALRSKGGPEIARMLIEAGADIGVKSPGEKRTPLMLAARNGDAATARLLIQHGADLEMEDFIGCRPLMHAAMQGGKEVAELLLSAGADPQARDHNSRTALSWVSPMDSQVSLLLSQRTHIAPEGRLDALIDAANKSHSTTMKLLLQQGVLLQEENEGGKSALIAGAAAVDFQILPLLLQAPGAKPDYRGNSTLVTPLIYAARLGRSEALEQLLAAGADPNVVDHQGQCAAHHAAARTDIRNLQRLYDAGAELHALDGQGRSLLHLACQPYTPRISDGAVNDLIDWLLKHGLKVDAPDGNGQTPLMLMAQHTRASVIQHLLDRGAEVNRLDSDGDTALSRVIGVGADFGYNERYRRPCSCNDDPVYPVVKALMTAGANPDIFGKLGDPVAGAKRWRCKGVVTLLKKRGAVR